MTSSSFRVVRIWIGGPSALARRDFISVMADSIYHLPTGAARATNGQVTVLNGRLHVDATLAIDLVEVPDPQLYGNIVALFGKKPTLGSIVIVDGEDETRLPDALPILNLIDDLATDGPVVIAARQQETSGWLDAATIRQQLDLLDAVPIVSCQVSQRESVRQVLVQLLYQTIQHIYEEDPDIKHNAW
jgi:signal recognition particle receptor subunit beta